MPQRCLAKSRQPVRQCRLKHGHDGPHRYWAYGRDTCDDLEWGQPESLGRFNGFPRLAALRAPTQTSPEVASETEAILMAMDAWESTEPSEKFDKACPPIVYGIARSAFRIGLRAAYAVDFGGGTPSEAPANDPQLIAAWERFCDAKAAGKANFHALAAALRAPAPTSEPLDPKDLEDSGETFTWDDP